MTMLETRPAPSVRPLALALAPLALALATPGQAETREGLRVATDVTAESRPLFAQGRNGDVAAGIRLAPWLRSSNDRTELDLTGDFWFRRFSKKINGDDSSINAAAALSHRLSPYVSLSSGVRFNSTRNGIGFSNVALPSPDAPPIPITDPVTDISLIGTRTRTQAITANLGVSARFSPRSQLSVSATASHSTSAGTGRDFNFYNTGTTYSHTLSPRVSVLASATYGKSHYLRRQAGDGTVISPMLGINLRLSPRLNLGVMAGVSITDTDLGAGAKSRQTLLAGTAHLCRSDERGSLCVDASRTAQPTAIGGIQTLSNVAMAYTKRLSERDNAMLNLQYSANAGGASALVNTQQSRLYTATGTWAHSFSRRLTLDVSPSYSRIHNLGRSYNSFRLLGSLRYTFGAMS